MISIKPIPLELVKSDKVASLNAICKSEIVSGFTSDALGSTHIYQSEEVDQINLLGLVLAGTDDYFKCGTTDENGNVSWEYKLHTAEQFKQVLQDGKNTKLSLLQKCNTLKVQVNEATSESEVNSVVW